MGNNGAMMFRPAWFISPLPETGANLSTPPEQFYALYDLQAAFRALKQPLAVAKEKGGLIIPWALVSL